MKKAWIYCAIDAPEDVHGMLKGQFRQLCDYAEQMEMEIVGTSSDCGGGPLFERSGFQHFIEAIQKGKTDSLLVVNRSSLSYRTMQLIQLRAIVESLNLEIWSPLEGRIIF